MRLPSLARISVSSTSDALTLARQLMQLVGALCTSVDRLLANSEAISVTQDVDLVAGTPKFVSHRLDLRDGQTPLGWHVVDKNADANVWRVSWDHRFITLQSDVNCTIRLRTY